METPYLRLYKNNLCNIFNFSEIKLNSQTFRKRTFNYPNNSKFGYSQ